MKGYNFFMRSDFNRKYTDLMRESRDKFSLFTFIAASIFSLSCNIFYLISREESTDLYVLIGFSFFFAYLSLLIYVVYNINIKQYEKKEEMDKIKSDLLEIKNKLNQ